MPSMATHLELDLVPVGRRYGHHHAWTHWDLNPGPSACEADVIPLHHVPLDDKQEKSFISPQIQGSMELAKGSFLCCKKK